ncbi:MAG: Hsp20 family protein, partial [Alphaproteobacteria bacterium]|nr:Hsp20 family protein [Alphaproteobacteria bacterium]
MRTFDLTPLYRSTVGFDRFASLLDNVMSHDVAAPAYPPYNIEKTGDDAWRITVAVAGFSETDITIESREGQLVISGKKTATEEDQSRAYLHRGIAER